MKPLRDRLQSSVLRRLEAGKPVARWQQFLLHVFTVARHIRRMRIKRLWFHRGGFWRIFWHPITLFRLGQLPVQIHSTCLIYPIGWFFWVPLVDYNIWEWRLPLMFTVLWFGSLLAHELAHVLMAKICGIPSSQVLFIPMGAVALLEKRMSAAEEFVVAAAGPLTSGLLAGAFYTALRWHWTHVHLRALGWLHFFQMGCLLNFFVAAGNLLPCFPLDGGRLLRSGLALLLEAFFGWKLEAAMLCASRITLRYVAWIAGPAAMYLVGYYLGDWFCFFLFPLLMLAAELEYRILMEERSQMTDWDFLKDQ